ncbi:MAG: ABC transporter permease [Negativicutes bacterium]
MVVNKISSTTFQLLIICTIIFIAMSVLNPGLFLSWDNFHSIAVQLAEPGLFTIGMAVTMMACGIDLSIVNTANLVAIVNAFILVNYLPKAASEGQIMTFVLLCMVLSVVIGAMCGAINGFLIAKLRILPILVTLGTMNLYMGLGVVISEGKGIFGFPEQLLHIGSGTFFGIPIPLVIFMVALILLIIIIHRTPFGLKVMWYGTNQKAALYSGINIDRVVFTTYIIAGVLGGIAGLLIMARTNSAKADYGTTYVLQTLLASVLGGVSPLGGKGNIFNVLLALLALQFLNSGFNFMRISSFVSESTYGALLIAVMLVAYIVERNRQKKLTAKSRKQQEPVSQGAKT